MSRPIVFRARSVAGFYSEWSPDIWTPRIKVLTKGTEHDIDLPAGLRFEPTRLGDVGEAALFINRRLEFLKQTSSTEAAEQAGDIGTVRALPKTNAPTAADHRMLQLLVSLRQAAWSIVGLLILFLIVTIWRLL